MSYTRILIAVLFFLSILSCSLNKEQPVSNVDETKAPKTIINGHILNADFSQFGTEVGVQYNDYTTAMYRDQKAQIDTVSGGFRLELDIEVPMELYFYHYMGTELLVTPGDSIHLVFDGSKKRPDNFFESLKISGDAATLNNEFTAFKRAFRPDYEKDEEEIRKEDPAVYKEYIDLIFAARDAQIETFIKEKNPSASFKNWLAIESAFAKKTKLLKYPPNFNMFTRKWLQVDDDYFDEAMTTPDFTEADLVNATLSSDYVRYYYYQFRTETRKTLTKEQAKNRIQGDSVFLVALEGLATKNRLLAQLVANQDLRSSLNNNSIDSYTHNEERINALFTNSPFAAPLKAKYLDVKNRLENPELPENAQLLAFQTEKPEDYLKEIIANAKGKVIYIDNWATWCGPCKQEFKESTPALKATFEKDVEFVYLCHQSDEKLWKPTIAEFKVNGKHYFLDKTESKPISKQINIQGYPTYTIINKKGEIVQSGFEFRPSEPITTDILNELIAEE